MDKPISNFKQIMDLVEQYPNDQILGGKVREIYWEQREPVANPNQLRIQFPDEELIEDKDIDSIAHRAID